MHRCVAHVLSSLATALVLSASAHAGTISGTAYCDIATNSGGQGSGNAVLTPTLGTLQSAISASAGTCATFTASAINFNTGYGNPGTSLNSFLNTQPGNILSSTYFATAAKNGNAAGSTVTGSQSSNGTLIVITGNTFITAGETITLSHDDGVNLYLTGMGLTNDLISPAGSANQTVAGQSPFTISGVPSGNYDFTLIYNSNYEQPAALVSNINVAQTPEPTSLLLLGTGALSLGGLIRRRLSA